MNKDTLNAINSKAAALGLSQTQIRATMRAHNGGVVCPDKIRSGDFTFSWEKDVSADLMEFIDELTDGACLPVWMLIGMNGPTRLPDPKSLNPEKRQDKETLDYMVWKGIVGPGATLRDIVATQRACASN